MAGDAPVSREEVHTGCPEETGGDTQTPPSLTPDPFLTPGHLFTSGRLNSYNRVKLFHCEEGGGGGGGGGGGHFTYGNSKNSCTLCQLLQPLHHPAEQTFWNIVFFANTCIAGPSPLQCPPPPPPPAKINFCTHVELMKLLSIPCSLH